MGDKLTEMYDAWMKTTNGDPSRFEAFQAGVTLGAVSMRNRAMTVTGTVLAKESDARGNATKNALKNAIGELPDIPEK